MAALTIGAAVLAGCSGGQQANETLPSASSTTATAEALPPLGPPDFPMPDEAREMTPEGAEAGLRYYLDLITHQAGVSGEPLRDLSRDCEFCTFIANRYDEDAAAGYSYRGGELTVEGMSRPAVNGSTAEFSLSLTQAAVDILDANNAPVPGRGQAAAERLNTGARMTWSSQQEYWVMNQIIVNS
ncbi:DUF6318 family protein [Modestobacter roseus]|uniref:DUF6318 family protein n=1 Tax=Modestobacter roseus TaxID=1181884 RepID=UPI001296699C|nr:DUF6318 family protein [Modestobacter roseus]MQA35471.1 hypothetical protein [Modestobacter roseus]